MKITLRGILALVLVAGVGLIAWSLAPLFTPPQPLLMPEVTSTPVASPVSTPDPSVQPTPALTPQPAVTPDSPVALPDPTGSPIRVTVKAVDGTPLVRTVLQPVKLRPDNRLVPPPGVGTWYAEPGWPLPGAASRYRSIVSGHVSGGGKPDVFYGLTLLDQHGGQGTVTVSYDSGEAAVFRIISVTDVGKTDVTTAPGYDWVWESPSGDEEQVLSLFTCDPTAPRVGGSSTDNIVVQAVRTA